MMIKHFKSRSADETKAIGIKHAGKLGQLICLYGNLGAGKTTFVKGLAQGIGIDSNVHSPTFTYQNIYAGPKLTLYHFDFYRATEPDQMLCNDLYDALSRKDCIIIVEWAENLEHFLINGYSKRTNIYFEHVNENERKIKIEYI